MIAPTMNTTTARKITPRPAPVWNIQYKTARRAKLDPKSAKAVFLEKEKSWGEKLFESFAAEQPPAQSARDVFTRAALRPGMLMTRAVADMEQMMRGSAIQARCLECPAPAAGRERPSSGLMAVLKSWLG